MLREFNCQLLSYLEPKGDHSNFKEKTNCFSSNDMDAFGIIHNSKGIAQFIKKSTQLIALLLSRENTFAL